MKFINVFGVIALSFSLLSGTSFSKEQVYSVNDLNLQLVNEVKAEIEIPLLIFNGKDLTGDAVIVAMINEHGKIEFVSVTSRNHNLKSNIVRKLNELNLWTDSQLTGQVFVYKVKFRK